MVPGRAAVRIVALRAALRSGKAQGVLAAVLLSGLAIWAAAGFTRESPPPARAHPGMQVGDDNVTLAADAPQWKILRLGVASAAGTRWTLPVAARVKIDEARASKVGAPLAGHVTQVFVELGQRVKPGDPLFSVASADIAALRAEREKAAVDVEATRAALERIRAMVSAHALAAKDEIEADQQSRRAEVALRLAESKLASLKVSSRADNEFTVVSPRAGVIVDKRVLPAQQVGADADLLEVADLAEVWVVAELFEADAAGVAVGTLARITSPSLPGLALDAKVEMVSAVVDPTRHTIPVRIRLDNERRAIRPNVFAEVRFAVDAPPGSAEIAASSLVSSGTKQFVYVQTDHGRFTRREVVVGSVREGKVPIFSGLKPSEVIVEEGAILLDSQVALSL